MKMKILVFNKQKDLPLKRGQLQKLVDLILSSEKKIYSEIAVYLVSEKYIRQLHEDFFQDPTPTDCITFPLEDNPLSGEIFVCPKTARLYAEKHGVDEYDELSLYVVHALLHLLGYDDLTPKERRTMRKKEKSCMRTVKEANLSLRP